MTEYITPLVLYRCGGVKRGGQWIELAGLDADTQGVLRIVMHSWYERVNCLNCKCNMSMHVEFDDYFHELALSVSCSNPGRKYPILHSTMRDGVIHIMIQDNCFPDPVPGEEDD